MEKTKSAVSAGGLKTYNGGELCGYLVGLAGQNIIYNIIGSGLMYYFQSVIFLPVMVCSVIVAIARVWDAVNDPMMGTIVDRTNTKWGKCKPYLLFVPVVVMVITILCFVNGRCSYEQVLDPVTGEVLYDEISKMPLKGALILSGSEGVRNVIIIAWAGISYILWGMSYTAGDIPLWGVTSLMTESAKARAWVLALARIVAAVGAIGMFVQLGGALFTGLFEKMLPGREYADYLQYSVIFIAVILTVIASVMFQFAGLSVKEKVHQQTEEHHTMKENFKTMWSCRPFRRLLVSGVLRSPIQLLATVAITLLLYFFFDNDLGKALKTENGLNISLAIKVVLIALGIFGGMLVASAVTPLLTRKHEKRTLYNFYSIVGAIPFGIVFVVYLIAGDKIITDWFWAIVTAIVFFAASWAQGGLNVLQSVMIADCVDYEEYNNGIRPDGVFFSGQSFITKLSAGIATIISGVVFAIVGWSGGVIENVNAALADGSMHFATDCAPYAKAMFFLVSIPPMIGMILSALPTFKYELTNEKHKQILDDLVTKRHESGEAE